MEEEVLDKYKVEESKREAFRGRGAPLGMEKSMRDKTVGRRLSGTNFLFVQRIQTAASAKQAGGANGRGRDEAAAKNGDHARSEKENQIKRKDPTTVGVSRSCLRRIVRKHGPTQDGRIPCTKWYEWLGYMKKEDEKENMEEMHQHKVEKMIKGAEGSAGLLHKITKPTPWRGGAQILKKEEDDARLLVRCVAKR